MKIVVWGRVVLFTEKDPFELSIPDASVRLWDGISLPDNPERIFDALEAETEWLEEDIVVFGKKYRQPRLLSWHGDPSASYAYSGVRHEPRPWSALLQALRESVQTATGHSFNSVLLNYYRNHRDSMGMHADDEQELGPEPVIASLSFGESRTFILKHKRDKSLARVKVPLQSGSLLVMSGSTQKNWKHGIDKERHPCGPRINLTFRTIY